MGRDTFHQTRVLKAPSSPALNTAREGAATASLGSLCQGLTTLTGKNFFLLSKSPLFHLEAITPCPITTCPCKKSFSSFIVGPFRYWKAAVSCPQSLLFSRLKSPNSLSLSSQQRCSSPWIIVVASSGPAPTSPGLSCAEGSRDGRSTGGCLVQGTYSC